MQQDFVFTPLIALCLLFLIKPRGKLAAVRSVEALLHSFNLVGCLFNDLIARFFSKYETPYCYCELYQCVLNIYLPVFNRTVYVHGFNKTDFDLWLSAITLAAGTDGKALSDQQLTKNGIPIILDSCIAFVTQYGELLYI